MNYLMALDMSLFHLINGAWTAPLLDSLMPALSRAGNLGTIWLVLLGAVAAFGKKTGRKIALAGLVALAVGFASSTLLKDLTVRPRPFLSLDEVRLLVSAPHSYAFPSGHTTSAFAAALGVVLAARRLLGRVPLWGWAMFPLAAAIAYSRIYVGVHWPTDVAAGGVLGLASGWAGARLALRRWRRKAVKWTAKEPEVIEAAPEVEYVLGEVLRR
jgi:undecaprenyl-diphosphatase